MVIYLNGEQRTLNGAASVAEMVERLDLPSQRLAVELNGSVVRKADWQATTVAEGDRVEVVQFVGGG